MRELTTQGTLASEMPYDHELANRVREQLADEEAMTEMAMFGGLAFLLHGNMAVAVSSRGGLMVRVGIDAAEDAVVRPHVNQIEMKGRPMRGWIHVAADGVKTRRQLQIWARRGVEFTRTLPAKG
jgi:hypothetical protein